LSASFSACSRLVFTDDIQSTMNLLTSSRGTMSHESVGTVDQCLFVANFGEVLTNLDKKRLSILLRNMSAIYYLFLQHVTLSWYFFLV
jgi:hypothetical protein